MPHTPYNAEFCAAHECPNLEHRGQCALDECIYNLKWIKHWEEYGVYPPEGVEPPE